MTSFQILQWVQLAWWVPKFKRSGPGWVAVKKIGLVLSLKHNVLGEGSTYFYFAE